MGACGVRGPLRWEGPASGGSTAPSVAPEVGAADAPGPGPHTAAGDGGGEALAERAFLRAVSAQGACRHDEAGSGFRAVLERWPGSAVAPDAMLRLGEVLAEPACGCHDPEAAREAFQAVTDRWPESAAAALARGYLAAPVAEGWPAP